MFICKKGIGIIVAMILMSSWVQAQNSIFCYHDVAAGEEMAAPYDISADQFKDQMDFLKRHNYNIVPLSAFADWVKYKKPLPPNAVGICFDDNYLGVYKNAFPILKKYKFPATNFAHTKYVGVMTAKDHADWKELQEMEDSGLVDIGSHAVTHTPLATLPIETARWELTESMAALQTHLKKKPRRYFAYPNISYNDEVVAEVEKAGYDAGFYGIEGPVDPEESPFKIRRFHSSQPTTLERFKKMLQFNGDDPNGPIIVDNDSTNFIVTGDWTTSSEKYQHYGDNYRVTMASEKPAHRAIFTLEIPKSGKYRAYAWYTSDSTRSAAVTYNITDAKGTRQVKINQKSKGGSWVSLGTYSFTSGKNARISVIPTGAKAATVAADAVKLEPVL